MEAFRDDTPGGGPKILDGSIIRTSGNGARNIQGVLCGEVEIKSKNFGRMVYIQCVGCVYAIMLIYYRRKW